MDLKMIECPKCGNDFPELRKTKYGYHVCVNCSTVKAKVGITTVEGTGDHTYNDIMIMDPEDAISYTNSQNSKNRRIKHTLNSKDEVESSHIIITKVRSLQDYSDE